MFAKEALDVTVLIDQLDASLTRSQYATIMSIVMDNFPEPWSVCPPVIEWPKRDPEVEEGVIRDPLKGRRTAQVRVGGGEGELWVVLFEPLLVVVGSPVDSAVVVDSHTVYSSSGI